MNNAFKFISEASADKRINTTDFSETLNLLCDISNLTVVIFDENGEILIADSSSDNDSITSIKNDFDSYQFSLNQELSFKQIYKESFSGRKYVERCGILPNGERFVIRASIANISTSVKIANKFMILVGLICFALGWISVVIVADKISKPIVKLTDISSKMTELDFDTRYESKGNSEIDILGENINKLSDKLVSTISELKCANNELKRDIAKKDEIEDMRKEFLSNVSHELKSPIALIQSYSEGLKEGIIDDEESRDYYLDVIIDEANRMNLLVREIMSLSELEFGKNPVEIERFNLIELINNKITASNILIKQNDIDLEFIHDEGCCCVWSDEFRIEEVFENYLSNAIHYCDNEKKIKISLDKKEDVVRVNVFNTGKCICDEDIDKIWDKFYKGDKARSRDYGGSGIGLSIVKAIMTTLNMDYGVYNTEGGVNFYFELPIK